MMQQAAIPLGITIRVLADNAGESAAQVIPATTVGDYRDAESLSRFADQCDVITFDHEQVPRSQLSALVSAGVTCRPGPHALMFAQDKQLMRDRLAALGVPGPRCRAAATVDEVADFAEEVGGWPVVLKTPRGGYDGRGVWEVADRKAALTVLEAGPSVVLVEERIRFSSELAAVVARSPHGQVACYPVVRSVQRDGICHEIIAPAPGLSADRAVAAQRLAVDLAAALDVVGVMAVELFDADDGRLLVNELAMRPHNSGHWSIDGAVTSQFENHLRAVLDLPLGSPMARAPWTVMVNVLGGDYPEMYPAFRHCMARDPELRIHLYGKEVRPGRKVGHVTAFGADLAEVTERARHAAGYLRGDIDE
jgi:5-(carboxyamino)imidazole ribonucleotide synthase